MTHIVDTLIEERATRLMQYPGLWRVLLATLRPLLGYRSAVEMADTISSMTGEEVLRYLSAALTLDVRVRGTRHVPPCRTRHRRTEPPDGHRRRSGRVRRAEGAPDRHHVLRQPRCDPRFTGDGGHHHSRRVDRGAAHPRPQQGDPAGHRRGIPARTTGRHLPVGAPRPTLPAGAAGAALAADGRQPGPQVRRARHPDAHPGAQLSCSSTASG